MSKASDLAYLAESLGGSFKYFSQSLGGIKGARTSGGYTSDKQNLPGNATDLYVGGTCHTMSLYWIVANKSGIGEKKTDFISWVLPAGPKGAPNMGAVNVLVAKTAMYKAAGPKAAALGIKTDPNFDASFFSRYGLINDNEYSDGADAVKAAISKSRHRYFMISYGREESGHCCAAMSSTMGDFSYFDPNYGEATVPIGACMRIWFDEYLKISGYKDKYASKSCLAYRY